MTVQSEVVLPRQRGRTRLQNQEMLAGLTFIAPWMIGFIVFTAGPMLVSLALSFTEYDVLQPPEFVGLENYQELLKDDRIALSLGNTIYYAVLHVPLAMAVAL